jgi:hypothetical protein
MNKIVTLVICCVYGLSYAQNTLIPDPNFEQALIDLGYDTGIPDGMIPTNNINTITFLQIGSENISDLTGIQDFTMLDTLRCSSNLLTSIDISQNQQLINLNCNNNNINVLNLQQNIGLKYLDCGFNQLTTLDISKNTNLLHLSFPQNDIGTIDISQNYILENFTCALNPISNLDFTQNPNLIRVAVSACQLTSLDLSQNPLLQECFCTNNQLSILDFSNNPLLWNIECQNNLISDLNISQNNKLLYLDCGISNQLTSLDVSHCDSLRFLYCDSNQLECLNLKNGYNSQMLVMEATGNPDLNCIEVDDPIWASLNWTVTWGNIDPNASFSNYCNNNCTTSLNELSTNLKTLVKITNVMGQEAIPEPNQLMIYIYSDGTTSKRFIIE